MILRNSKPCQSGGGQFQLFQPQKYGDFYIKMLKTELYAVHSFNIGLRFSTFGHFPLRGGV